MGTNRFRQLNALAYPLARSVLFCMDAERAHHLTLKGLSLIQDSALAAFREDTFAPGKPLEVMGLKFPNRLGLAAGLDKGATCIDGFGALGFGHIEVGTLTPRPQPGNPKPRLFRLKTAEAVINRMGFNNPGIDDALTRIQKRRFPGVLGINIGKNFDTPNEKAVDDYVYGLRQAYGHADYVAVNLSSPNTKALRELQFVDQCRPLLEALLEERRRLSQEHSKHCPIAVKVAPDLEETHARQLADLFADLKLNAVIATNTTLAREPVAGLKQANEAGGLSGRPLREKATEVISWFHDQLGDALPIIGAGGISSAADAQEKLDAGATLIQIYTGFIYNGPALIEDILRLDG